MKDIPTWLPVVAAAILDRSGQVLMHQRPPGKIHGGLWEFPGGKVEPHEIPRKALVREIAEELGIALDPATIEPVAFAESRPGEGAVPIVILLYIVRSWQGEPVSLEGGGCGWFSLAAVAGLAKPPLDARLLGMLVRGLAG